MSWRDQFANSTQRRLQAQRCIAAGLTRSTRGRTSRKGRAGEHVPAMPPPVMNTRGNVAGKPSHLISYWLTGG